MCDGGVGFRDTQEAGKALLIISRFVNHLQHHGWHRDTLLLLKGNQVVQHLVELLGELYGGGECMGQICLQWGWLHPMDLGLGGMKRQRQRTLFSLQDQSNPFPPPYQTPDCLASGTHYSSIVLSFQA